MTRYALIWFLDLLDVWVLRHRFPRVCAWIVMHPWWDLRPARTRTP